VVLQGTKLGEGVDAGVGVGADAQGHARQALDGEEAVAEVKLGGGADADPAPGAKQARAVVGAGVGEVHRREVRRDEAQA
jgi:hypothetical protein